MGKRRNSSLDTGFNKRPKVSRVAVLVPSYEPSLLATRLPISTPSAEELTLSQYTPIQDIQLLEGLASGHRSPSPASGHILLDLLQESIYINEGRSELDLLLENPWV